VKKLWCLLALSGVLLSNQVFAWGNDGHRIVGAIADRLIKGRQAEKQVDALLLPGENLENVANWLDCVKGSNCGPQTPEMIAYTSANPLHQEYHYTDIPFQNAHYRDGAVGSSDHDVVQILKQAIAVLRGKDDDASNPHHFTRRQALLLVVHLVGDIEQPLHVGNEYIGKDGGFVVPQQANQVDGTNIFDAHGGNSLLLDEAALKVSADRLLPAKANAQPSKQPTQPVRTAATTQPSPPLSFHAYWDHTAVDYAMRRIGAETPQQFAQMAIAGKPAVAAAKGDPASWPYRWADDSLQVAKLAHVGLVPGQMSELTNRKGEQYKVWALDLPLNYPLTSSTLATTQLIKGGYRLAALLEAIWPGAESAR
jgi:S1/P1 Nuclease